VKNLRLVTLQAIPAPFDASKGAAGLPTRFRVLPWGDNKTTKGQVIVNTTTLNTLPGYQKEMNWDKRVALDFEHCTVPGTPGYSVTAPVAGYGPIEVVEGDGLYMSMLSWTDDGKQLAGGGHFADVSATVILNEHNEVIGVHSVALCRNGAAPGAVFLSAWPVVEQRPPQTADELFAALKTALGAAHDATPTQVVETLTSRLMADDPTKTKEAPAKVPEKAADSTAVAVETLSTQIADLTKLVTPLAGQREDAERGAEDAQRRKRQARARSHPEHGGR